MSPPDVAPAIIGQRYELGARIGQGGMGTVFSALDTVTGERVAVKLLRPAAVRHDPTGVERFLREGEALRRLDHPNIVKRLAALEQEGQHCLVMEFVAGGSLEDELRSRTASLTIERVLGIALDLSDALARTHRLDIIHRDIKPSNVLIAEDGTPKLSDFGVAHFRAKERITASDRLVGTIDYLSPEQLRGENVDVSNDLWALGVLIFEMLTGRPPFEAEHAAATLHAIMTRAPPDLEALRPDCPLALVDLTYRMLAKQASQRIATARRVGAEIERIIEERARIASRLQPAPSASLGLADSRFDAALEPPSKPDAVEHVLPTQATPFVGRERELAELASLASDAQVRLVSIVGAGGMGKSRLAIETVRLVSRGLGALEATLPGRDPFSGRVCLVELAPLVSSELVVSAIADALGFQFYPGGEPKAQLIAYLREKTLVLVLDNFEHVLAAARLVEEILEAAPGVRVIATSRERLGLSRETVFGLSGLSLPGPGVLHPEDFGAIQLFVQSARRAKLNFELTRETAHEVARICQLVSGMPLGIVLAAAWTSLLTAKEIADEIAMGIDFLKADLCDMPERQHSIRALFDHSWRLSSVEARLAFSRLSVFRGGFTRAAAHAVAGADLRALLTLSNKSLLTRDPATGRFEIHELLRQYAESRLLEQPDEYERTARLHGAYFADFLRDLEASLKGPSPEIATREIETEIDNVRGGWSRLLALGRTQEVSLAIESLQVFHTLRSSFAEAEGVFKAAADAFLLPRPAPGSESARLAGFALALQAGYCDSQWRYREAAELARRALDWLDERRHPREAARALFVWGFALISAGSKPQGFELAERGLDLYRTTDDYWGTANALAQLAIHYRDWSGPVRAEACYRESLAIQQNHGARTIVIPQSLGGLGYIRTQRGDYAEGGQRLLESLALSEKRGDRWNEELCLHRLAGAQVQRGDYQSAEVYARRALALSGDVVVFAENWGHLILGEVLLRQGRLDEAAIQYQEGLGSESGRTAASAKSGLGAVAFERGAYAEAKSYFSESLSAFEALGTTWGIAVVWAQLGYLACQEHDYPGARVAFQRALAFEADSLPFVIDVVAGIALLLARLGEAERAAELLAKAQRHPAVARHTLVRRIQPLLAELTGVLPAGELALALRGGQELCIDFQELARDALALVDDA